jgi:hypothetical protein
MTRATLTNDDLQCQFPCQPLEAQQTALQLKSLILYMLAFRYLDESLEELLVATVNLHISLCKDER